MILKMYSSLPLSVLKKKKEKKSRYRTMKRTAQERAILKGEAGAANIRRTSLHFNNETLKTSIRDYFASKCQNFRIYSVEALLQFLIEKLSNKIEQSDVKKQRERAHDEEETENDEVDNDSSLESLSSNEEESMQVDLKKLRALLSGISQTGGEDTLKDEDSRVIEERTLNLVEKFPIQVLSIFSQLDSMMFELIKFCE